MLLSMLSVAAPHAMEMLFVRLDSMFVGVVRVPDVTRVIMVVRLGVTLAGTLSSQVMIIELKLLGYLC